LCCNNRIDGYYYRVLSPMYLQCKYYVHYFTYPDNSIRDDNHDILSTEYTSRKTAAKRENEINIIIDEFNGIITTNNNILDHQTQMNNSNVVICLKTKLILFDLSSL